MTNFVQPGDCITIASPGTVASGDAVQVGQMLGIATHDAATGENLTIKRTGVFDVTKVGSQAWTVGAVVYFTGTAFTTVASGNLRAGFAVVATGAGAGETTGRVCLDGVAAPDAS